MGKHTAETTKKANDAKAKKLEAEELARQQTRFVTSANSKLGKTVKTIIANANGISPDFCRTELKKALQKQLDLL